MEKSKVDLFMMKNAQFFPTEIIISVKEKIEKMDDDRFLLLQSLNFKNSNYAMIYCFFALDRLYLNDIGLGILKFALMFFIVGFLWWIIDFFTIAKRVQDYNMKELNKVV